MDVVRGGGGRRLGADRHLLHAVVRVRPRQRANRCRGQPVAVVIGERLVHRRAVVGQQVVGVVPAVC